MPKAKTSSRVSSISKLSPFFRKRTDKPKLELHDYILASDTTSTSYPTFWADPEVLSQTSAYRIRRIGKLPSTLENVINMYSSQDVRVHSSQLFNCITIATPDSIYIYFYKKRNNDRVIHLSMEENQEPPIVNMVSNDTQTIGILAVSKSGHITYWKQYSDTSSFLKYKLSLSQQEQITAVESIRGQRAIIGSSHENIYLVDYNANKLTVFSFYKQMNFATFLSNMLFVTNPVESRSSVVKSSLPCKGKILRIRFSQGHAYIAYTEHMAVWNINDQNEIKLSTVISIHHHLKEALSRHIPSHVSRDYIKTNLLDICLSENNTFTVLVSYSVPEMGNYVQYAVISLTYSGSILRENTPLWILHTASVPYSVIPDTLQRTPSLLISEGLAFVTFDRTMIAVSMDKNSVFEERVVLKQEEDDMLCTQVNQTAEASALMITRKGIIEFQVDTNKIRRPSAEGNIYAVAVDDTNERDTLIFKSRLEQAVFFGVPEQGPLQFPLRTEQEDISKAVLSLTDDILKGCELLPKSLELGFYIESRYVFSNRIMSVLTDNGLIHSMTENERFKILKTTEYYYLAIVLYETLVENSNFTLQFSAAIQSVLQENSGDLIRAFLIDHPFDVNRLIEQFFSTFEVFDFNLEETALYLQKINTVILSLANRAYNYEEKYLPLYEISHHFGDLWMIASASDLLMKAFEKTQDYVCLSSLNNVTDQSMAALKDNLCEIANLLLNHLSIEIYKSVGDVRQNYADKLSNTKSVIIQKLCACQQYQVAIELAEKYNDLPAIVAALQTSQLSDEEVQTKHIYFIQAYGYDYFTLLLNWLNDHGEDEKILLLSKHVPDYVDKFFENNPVKISWTYYLLQENYMRYVELG
ncbi:hypothetical protein G6F66_010882 [Rhizopus arrhizus]|nr:hypothetical protein G6F66_010882 [Rhizopus arrhizus]